MVVSTGILNPGEKSSASVLSILIHFLKQKTHLSLDFNPFMLCCVMLVGRALPFGTELK
jgi:hypothetical protein